MSSCTFRRRNRRLSLSIVSQKTPTQLEIHRAGMTIWIFAPWERTLVSVDPGDTQRVSGKCFAYFSQSGHENILITGDTGVSSAFFAMKDPLPQSFAPLPQNCRSLVGQPALVGVLGTVSASHVAPLVQLPTPTRPIITLREMGRARPAGLGRA